MPDCLNTLFQILQLCVYRQAIFARAWYQAEKKGLGCTWSNWAFEHSHLTVKFGGTKLSSAISISHLLNINRAGADESRIEPRHFIFAYIMIVCMIVRQVFELPPCMLTHGRNTNLLSVLPLSSNRLLVAVLMQWMKAALFAMWHTAWTLHHVRLIAATSTSQREVPLLMIVLCNDKSIKAEIRLECFFVFFITK